MPTAPVPPESLVEQARLKLLTAIAEESRGDRRLDWYYLQLRIVDAKMSAMTHWCRSDKVVAKDIILDVTRKCARYSKPVRFAELPDAALELTAKFEASIRESVGRN